MPLPSELAPEGAGGSWELDVTAASLQIDAADSDSLFETLGAKLGRILPQLVEIERSGLFKNKAVVKISVHNGEDLLEATKDKRGPVFKSIHQVRGITLSTSEVPADQWLERVMATVRAEAQRNAKVREALSGLVEP